MDTFRAMQAFVGIADHGSLTGAARALDSSLPAMVRTLAALEKHLGVRLLNRTTRRIGLTEEGRRYLEHCRHVLASVQEAEAQLRQNSVEASGSLSVTAPVQFGQMYVAPAVTAFALCHPKLQCRVMLFDRRLQLQDEGLDVGVRIGPLEDSSLVARPLGLLRRMLVASPRFLAQHGMPGHPRDLEGAPSVRFSGLGASAWPFQDGRRSLAVRPGGNLEFNHIAPAVEACADGAGFGQFMSYQVAPWLAQGRLVLLLEEYETAPRPVSIVYPHARLLPARTRLLIDWLLDDLPRRAAGALVPMTSALTPRMADAQAEPL